MLSRPLSASWYRPTQRGLENPPSSHVTHHSLPPQCFGLDHSSLWIGDHVGAIHQWRLEDEGDDRDAQTTTTTLIRMSTSEPVHALHSTPIGTDGVSRVRALIASAHTHTHTFSLSLSLLPLLMCRLHPRCRQGLDCIQGSWQRDHHRLEHEHLERREKDRVPRPTTTTKHLRHQSRSNEAVCWLSLGSHHDFRPRCA